MNETGPSPPTPKKVPPNPPLGGTLAPLGGTLAPHHPKSTHLRTTDRHVAARVVELVKSLSMSRYLFRSCVLLFLMSFS